MATLTEADVRLAVAAIIAAANAELISRIVSALLCIAIGRFKAPHDPAGHGPHGFSIINEGRK